MDTPEQSLTKVVDVPVDVASKSATVEGSCRMVEVASVIPQERIKPAGESASVRFTREHGGSPSSRSGDGQRDTEGEAPNKRRKQERDPDSRDPVLFSVCDGSSDRQARDKGQRRMRGSASREVGRHPV